MGADRSCNCSFVKGIVFLHICRHNLGVLVSIDDFGLEQKGGISGVPGYTWRQKTQVESWLCFFMSLRTLGKLILPFFICRRKEKVTCTYQVGTI